MSATQQRLAGCVPLAAPPEEEQREAPELGRAARDDELLEPIANKKVENLRIRLYPRSAVRSTVILEKG
jgi:hypothetical protein